MEIVAMQVVSETTNATKTWLEKVLPVLRAKQSRELFYFGSDKTVVALFKDKIVLGRTRKSLPIGDGEATPDELEGQLCGQLRRRQVIPLASVVAVAVERPRLLSSNICRFRLTSPSGTFRFVILRREVGNFLRALQELLGDRIVLEKRIKFHTWGALSAVLFLLLTMAGGILFAGDYPLTAILFGCLSPLLLFIPAYIIFSHLTGEAASAKCAGA
jgi:hypothetical protein